MGLDIAAFQFATKLDPQPTERYEWLWDLDDCEGCMTGPVAATLAADFRELRETVLPKWDPDEPTQAWFREKYDDWQEAFALAAGRGLVVFR